MERSDALRYVAYSMDNALNYAKAGFGIIPNNAKLIGWQAGFEPVFVAVSSYLGDTLGDDEAVELATDLLSELNWFSGGEPTEPDYIIGGRFH